MSVFLLWLLPILVFVLFALHQRSSGKSTEVDSVSAAILIHKERLADLEKQYAAGTIDQEEYESFKFEEEKALLFDADKKQSLETNEIGVPWITVPLVAVGILGSAFFVYLQIGNYDGVEVRRQFTALTAADDSDVQAAMTALDSFEKYLQKDLEDIDGWFRLSQMQLNMEQFEPAIDSLNVVLAQLRRVEHQAEDESTIISYIGQAQMALGREREALASFEESLEYNALNNVALGLAGRASFVLGDYQDAIDYWTRLRLNNASGDNSVIDGFIERAKAELSAQGIEYEEVAPTRILVDIQLPAAWEGLPNEAALFVYARPIGQRMPLAVKRLPVNGQSMTVMLSDADAMGPMGGISTQTEVEVTARVSLNGVANTAPGDWMGTVQPVTLDQKETKAEIEISQP